MLFRSSTYTITYEVTNESGTVSADRQVIVLAEAQEEEPILTQQMEGINTSTSEYEGPTQKSSINVEQDGEVNEYEEVEG